MALNVTPAEIETYLRDEFGEMKSSGNNWVLKYCTFCNDHKNKADNLWKIAFRKDTGAFNCPRCGAHGSFLDFKRRVSDPAPASQRREKAPRVYNKPDQKVSSYPTALQAHPDVYRYLCADRKLTPEAVKHYRIGAAEYSFQHEDQTWNPHLCVTFPWIEYDAKGTEHIVRVKARALDEKSYMRLDPAGGAWGWFGWHTVPNDAMEIVITEGEIDAVTVWQELQKAGINIPVISLPNGASSLPDELLPHLERFDKIFLWLDDDTAGRRSIEPFAKKLGLYRTYIVRTRSGQDVGPKDANDALRAECDLQKLVMDALPLDPAGLANPDVVCMANVETEEISWFWKPYIPKKKITVLLGDPGCGKTFLICALSTAASLGRGLPSSENGEPGNVLIFNAEDGVEDTIKQRLNWMDADQNKIFCFKAPVKFDDDGFKKIEEVLSQYRPVLVSLDPIQAYMGAELDMNRANETRPILQRLGQIAEKYDTAFVVVCHMNKNNAVGKSLHRALGSIDIVAAARSVILAGKLTDGSDKRALLPVKCSVASEGKPLGYVIEAQPDGSGKFVWLEGMVVSEADLMGSGSRGSSERVPEKRNQAEEFLREFLANSAKPQKQIEAEAKARGIAEKTLFRAKEVMRKAGELKCIPVREPGKSGVQLWHWSLTLPASPPTPLDGQVPNNESGDHLNSKPVSWSEPQSDFSPNGPDEVSWNVEGEPPVQ